MKSANKRSGLVLYLVLNVIVSAATTLAVLSIWDRVMRGQMPPAESLGVQGQATATLAAGSDPVGVGTEPVTAAGPLIEIGGVTGAGDLSQEYILLRRIGEGDLRLSGWTLRDEDGNEYIFPGSPELVLFKDGAVQVSTRAGEDTPTEVFWNLTEAVWASGEQITVVDQQGNVQATYQVP